jgi:hypothetical protein
MRSCHCSSLSKLRRPNGWPLSDRLWPRTLLTAVKFFAVTPPEICFALFISVILFGLAVSVALFFHYM